MKEVESPKRPLIFYYLLAILAILLFNYLAKPYMEEQAVETVDYGTFMDMTENKEIGKVDIEENQIVFTNRDESQVYKTGLMADIGLVDRLHKSGAQFSTDIKHKDSPLMNFILTWILPIIVFYAIGQYMSRKLMDRAGGGNSMMFGFGKSQAKIYVPSSEGIHFSDVAGEDEAKENLSEIVDYLHNPKKYSSIGASMPKGVLLVGPPGTGKTMLAKAVAGEANVPFFSIAGSEFVEMFVGMGASKVRDLFDQAKKKAPCIVFIDEIDAIGQKRSGNVMGNDEREQTLNQLLTEMDGFEGNNGVIILAATNRPESLDPALLRPGRFDRRVPVELPDLKGREEILKVHAKKVRVGEDVDFHVIARMAAGASGAELANIINEGALRAVRGGRAAVTQTDLEESVEVVIAGYQKKNAILSDTEKRTVAYHEIGHALVAAKQTNEAPVQKITIIPRTSGALGYTMQVEQQDKYLLSKEELEQKIATLTGGRAAEEVAFGRITTGAANDIERATKLARSMITRYGMSDEFGMVAMEQVTNQYLGGDTSLQCAPDTAREIDAKVVALVKKEHEKARTILKENKAALDRLATFLYEKETITGDEFMQLLREVEGGESAPIAESAESTVTVDDYDDDDDPVFA
ncbi:MAG: ATP-dependent zinc metalloprotease FtsH [Selenomonadaceae bacterium]